MMEKVDVMPPVPVNHEGIQTLRFSLTRQSQVLYERKEAQVQHYKQIEVQTTKLRHK